MQSAIGCGKLPLKADPIDGLAKLKKAKRAVAFVIYFRSPTHFQELISAFHAGSKKSWKNIQTEPLPTSPAIQWCRFAMS
jgi:hypothetical protein